MFKTEEVTSYTDYTPFKFQAVGDNITMLISKLEEVNGENGKFQVVKGVAFEVKDSEEAMIKTAYLGSFVAKAVIKKALEDKKVIPGEVYTIQLTDKDVKAKTGGRKYDNFKILKLLVPDSFKSALRNFEDGDFSFEVEEIETATPKPKSI